MANKVRVFYVVDSRLVSGRRFWVVVRLSGGKQRVVSRFKTESAARKRRSQLAAKV